MHKVERNKAPVKLIKKDKEWESLLEKDSTLKPDWTGFSRSTLKNETMAALEVMYKGCCCYCESKIKSTSYPEIEHFKPKSKYPEECFDYSNLHYCCKRCNVAKSSNYNEILVSPSTNNPEDYIRYVGEIATSIDNNERGNETIKTLKLNDRTDLKEERIRYLKEFSRNYELLITAIETILEDKSSKDISMVKPFVNSFIENVKLKSIHGESYCTMIKHNFSDKLDLLNEFLKEV
jgi:uncharacterized protein (TIGR02646 family)